MLILSQVLLELSEPKCKASYAHNGVISLLAAGETKDRNPQTSQIACFYRALVETVCIYSDTKMC